MAIVSFRTSLALVLRRDIWRILLMSDQASSKIDENIPVHLYTLCSIFCLYLAVIFLYFVFRDYSSFKSWWIFDLYQGTVTMLFREIV